MANIYKKLLLLFCLYMVCVELKAQVNGHPPRNNQGVQRMPPVRRDYAQIVRDFQTRYPERNIPSKPAMAFVKGNRLPENNNRSYEALRQQYLQRFPELQQRITRVPQSKTHLQPAEERSYNWCLKHLLPKIKAKQSMKEQEP
jgi:hypothetical protein